MTNIHREDLVPDGVEVVHQEGGLAELSLVQVDDHIGIGPVSSRNVEESAVSVRKISGLYHMNFESAVEEICLLLKLQHVDWKGVFYSC